MSLYESHLKKGRIQNKQNRYTRKQLESLTTLQLREICYREKLVKGISNSLDRKRFIETILHFRGVNHDYLIKHYDSNGFSRINQYLKKHLGQDISHQQVIHNPAHLTIYKGLAIEKQDHYLVETEKQFLDASNVFLVNDQNELCGVFTLEPIDESKTTFALCMPADMTINEVSNNRYHLLYFRPSDSDYLYDIYQQEGQSPIVEVDYYSVPLTDLKVAELEETNQVLSIDFGTSNSTVGIFINSHYQELIHSHALLNHQITLDQINYVHFSNDDEEKKTSDILVPTVVSIENCENEDEPSYQFGYEALKDKDKLNVFENRSIFFELKRWVYSYHQKEFVMDAFGNTGFIQRGVMIRAYFHYLIHHAEQQFKCRFKKLHISSPVKMKEQFLLMFEEILPEYEIERENSLDEGISVLYNTISKQLAKNTFRNSEEYQALIFDCGGGTTDLSSCTFRIEDNRISYDLAIKTTFENGNVNFGGNNLTYRILQLLKIRFAEFYGDAKDKAKLDQMFPCILEDCYRYIDEYGITDFYAQFEQIYNQYETVIPTQFARYRNQNHEVYQRVKANYYVLWSLAEKIKQHFFETSDVWQVSIGNKSIEFIDQIAIDVNEFRLSIYEKNQLSYVYQIPDLIVNRKEVEGLLKGDIYAIIASFFDQLYRENKLEDFSIIKMTGQSCKIPLFREALKEYIAGKHIEFRQKDNPIKELKLTCLDGVIQYLEDYKSGVIKPKIINDIPEIPYSIYGHDHHDQKVELLLKNEKINQTSGFISKNNTVKEVKFFLQMESNEYETMFLYQNDLQDFTPITYEVINQEFNQYIRQDDVDNIEDDEIKFFVYANENKWGFYVLPIMRQAGALSKGIVRFYPFENETWEINFFDGTK